MARYMEELTEEKKIEIKRRLDEYLRQYHEDLNNIYIYKEKSYGK